MRAATVKHLEERLGENIHDSGLDTDFLSKETQAMKQKLKNVSIKIKNLWSLIDTAKKWKATDKKKILANHVSNKELNAEYIKKSYLSTRKQTINEKHLNRYFTKGAIWISSKHIEKRLLIINKSL